MRQRIALAGSAAYTTSGNTPASRLDDAKDALLFLNVTAVSGSGITANVWLQASNDNGTTWFDLKADETMKDSGSSATEPADTQSGKRNISNANITATGKWIAKYNNMAATHVRGRWVISGTTPSLTFDLTLDVS